MSVATRLQAMQPTDVGVPGPTSWDMARAFRSIRADPLTFLGEVSQHYGDTRLLPGARRAGAAGQRPGRRPARAPDLGAQLGQGHRAVRRPGARHRPRPARLGRAELDRPPTARRPGLPPPAPGGGGRRGARGRPHRHRGATGRTARRRGRGRRGRRRRRPDPHASASTPSAARSSRADLSDQAQRPAGRPRARPPTWWCGSAARSCPRAEWTPTRTNLRLRSARRRLDAGAAAIIAERRARNARAGGTPHHGDDLLGLLLDSGLTDGEIRDELVTMVIAGHETVAAALAWTLMLLAEHPEAQERVRSELDAHPGPVPLRRAPRAPAVDARGRRRGAAPLPTGLGHLPPLAPRRRGRRTAGPGRHARHHQPLAGPPASRPLARARGLPSRALPRRHRPHRLPAVRAGAAAVHRAGVRARRDGRRPRRAAARAPHRRARRPGGWTRPVAEATGRRPPPRRHAARRTTDGHAVTAALVVDLALALLLVGAAVGAQRLVADLRTLPRSDAPTGDVTARCRCRWWSRRVTRSRPCLRCCGRWPSSCRRSARSSWWTTRRATRPPPWHGRAAPASCRPARHPPAGPARPGPATPAPRRRRATCCSSSTPTPSSDRVPSPACSPRTPGTAGSCRCSRYHDVVRPYEQLSAYFNVVALMASGAFTRRGRVRATARRWRSGRAC